MKFISAGHCDTKGPNYDPGASGVNKRYEAHETVRMRNAVIAALKAQGIKDVITDLDAESLKQYLTRIKSGTGSVVCEFHFNAFDGKATGIEVIVQQDADKLDIACARDIAQGLHDITGLVLRSQDGVIREDESKRGRLGLMRENGIVVLVELCFIDNPSDMAAYDKHFDEIAEFMAEVLHKYDLIIR